MKNFDVKKFLTSISLKPEFAVPVLLIGIIVFLVIPMPTWLLDTFLALNLSLSVIILLISIYALKPLEFSIFPGVLLITALFRLSLNVSSTRLILSEGYAGDVIQTFGTFVTKGNIIVGIIIFIILVIIQMVVITKGAGRIAEVAARFTLDAMPGKQMAIDADLNAGTIDEAEARKRREEIRGEADFYGAMDGASKFVKGDAIAGIIITIINLVGGIIIGLVMGTENLTFVEVMEKYSKLTIGDGLVSQLPSLMISTASGLIVARAGAESNLGNEVVKQLFSNTKTLVLASIVLALFGFVPGLPKIPFWTVSLALASIAYVTIKNSKKIISDEVNKSTEKQGKKKEQEENIDNYLLIDPMELEIGYALISLVDSSQGGDLLDRIALIRKQIAVDFGFKVPPIRIRDNFDLKPNEYVVKIKGLEIGKAEVMPGYYLVMDPGTAEGEIDGIPTKEPTFGLDAYWVTETQKDEADALGYTVVEITAVVTTHLTELIKDHAYELITREDVKELVENVKKVSPVVVDEVIPDVMKMGDLQKVLSNLLWEKISIRDLATIIETLGDYGKVTKNHELLTEYARHALSRQISASLVGIDGIIRVITLSTEAENILESHLQADNNQNLSLVLPQNVLNKFVEQVKEKNNFMLMQGKNPVLLVSPVLRMQVRRVLYPYINGLSVVSVSEIRSEYQVVSEGEIKL